MSLLIPFRVRNVFGVTVGSGWALSKYGVTVKVEVKTIETGGFWEITFETGTVYHKCKYQYNQGVEPDPNRKRKFLENIKKIKILIN